MPISDSHLRGLGRVAVNFQSLEICISFITGGLVGTEQVVGQMDTAQSPFGKLCILASSLFEYRFGKTELGSRFGSLITQNLKLEEKRNQLFHSAWLTDDTSGKVSRLKMSLKLGKGLSHSTPPVSPDEVNSLADEIAATTESFLGLIPELQKTGASEGTKMMGRKALISRIHR